MNETEFEQAWKDAKEALVDPAETRKKAIMAQLLQNTKNHFFASLPSPIPEIETPYSTKSSHSVDDLIDEEDPWLNLLITIKKHYKLAPYHDSIGTLNRVILPMIRRVMPSVIANEIIGIQPMTGPSAQVHSLRVRYG